MREADDLALCERLEAMASDLGLRRVGVDAIHLPSWGTYLEVGGEAFLRRVYSQAELAQAEGEPERLASRFAGKEAVLKVLGSGISRVGLGAVEILCEESGRPWVKLGGAAMAVAEREGLENFEVSLCHEQDYALAVACATRLEARQ